MTQACETTALYVPVCLFVIDGRHYAIDTRDVREALAPRPIDRVALAPAQVAGVVPYRGEVLTVLYLRTLLGLPALPPTESAVLVVALEGHEDFGIAADNLGGVLNLDRSTRLPTPATVGERGLALFAGAYRTHVGLVMELNTAEIAPDRSLHLCGTQPAVQPLQEGSPCAF